MPFFGGSKSSSTSYSTEQGAQTGDDSVSLILSSSEENTFTTDTPAVLTYLTGSVRDVSGQILETSLDASLALQETTLDASRRQTDTAAQLNTSLAEGIKELNLKALETKSATNTARNLLIAAVVTVFLLVAFLLKKPSAASKNVVSKKSK